jgi:hypothetical protein
VSPEFLSTVALVILQKPVSQVLLLMALMTLKVSTNFILQDINMMWSCFVWIPAKAITNKDATIPFLLQLTPSSCNTILMNTILKKTDVELGKMYGNESPWIQHSCWFGTKCMGMSPLAFSILWHISFAAFDL